MDMIGTAPDFAVLCLHQEEFEVIWCSQVLGNACLTHSFFPQHIAFLTTQAIPTLLVVIDDSPDKIALQFFQGHSSSFSRFLRCIDAECSVGQSSLETLGHPTKNSLDGSLR